MRRMAGVAVGVLVLTSGLAQAATSSRTVKLDGRYKWGTSMRFCVAPRAASVTCIAGKRKVTGLGTFEYERDAVSTGANTSDGCPEYDTHGWIWINGAKGKKGGKIAFRGVPAAECGKDPQQPSLSPDANYVVTLVTASGKGVLKGATGGATVLAAGGTDIWAGSVTLRK